MKKWLYIILPILILGLLIVWRLQQKMAENAAQTMQANAKMKGTVSVALGKVEIKDLEHSFDVMGSVEAPLNVNIAPKVTGRINYLDVHEGDKVSKGQVLIKIDSSDIDAQVQQAEAAVAEARYRLAQAQLVQNPNDVSVNTQIAQQKSALTSAKADYDQALKSADAQLMASQANLKDADSKIDNANALIKGAKANVDNAQAKYNRVNSLFAKGFVSAQDVDDAKAALAVQGSLLEIAQSQLNSANSLKDSAVQQLNVTKAQTTANIAASKAKLDQANASLEFANSNTSQKSAYRESISALKAQVSAAQAMFISAKSKQQDTVLRSPLDGFVTGRFSDPGAIASPNQPVLAVQFTKQIWVSFSLPEDVSTRIHIGQSAKISLDAFPDKTFNASVIQMNPSADPLSRQFTVRVIMSNPNGMFKPGMFAHVSLETDKILNAIVVPREAVQSDRAGSFVITVGLDETAKRIPVTPLGGDDSYINIGNSLKPGDNVVIMSSMPLKDGQKVKAGSKKKSKGGSGWSGKAGMK